MSTAQDKVAISNGSSAVGEKDTKSNADVCDDREHNPEDVEGGGQQQQQNEDSVMSEENQTQQQPDNTEPGAGQEAEDATGNVPAMCSTEESDVQPQDEEMKPLSPEEAPEDTLVQEVAAPGSTAADDEHEAEIDTEEKIQAHLITQLMSNPCPSGAILQPPKRLSLPLPRDGFMCEQCGDRYVLPSSLAQHSSRRVMNIFYKCPQSKKVCLFSNRCQLLEHLENQKISLEDLDPALLEVTPLSTSDLCAPAKVFPVSDNAAVIGPPQLTRMVQPEPVKKPVFVSCPVCNILCSSDTLATHLCPNISGDTLDTPPPRCPECAQPCPTECCLVAHQGLHKPNLWPYPYVCPECGLKMICSFEEYRQHVIGTCLHVTRDLKSCCSLCLIEVGDITAHMVQTHVHRLFKCRQCPLAFESVNGFNSHVKAKHDGQLISETTPYMTIIKCPFCSATFNNAKTLREHMASKRHGSRVLEMVKFVFRCPECSVDYGRKELLADHLACSHPDFQLVKPPANSAAATLEATAPSQSVEHTPNKAAGLAAGGVSGGSARGRGRGRGGRPPKYPRVDRLSSGGETASTGEVKNMRTERDLIRSAPHKCTVCDSVFRVKADFIEHSRSHLEEGVPLCLLCNVRFDDEDSLKLHIADHACEIGRDRCGLCYTKLGSRDALQSHLENEHNMRDFSCLQCGLSFERLTELNRHNYSKHSGGKPGRPPKRNLLSTRRSLSKAAASNDCEEEEEEDDLPLSAVTARASSTVATSETASRTRRGTLPNVTSLYELDDSYLTNVAPPPTPGTPRFVSKRGRPRGGNSAAAARAAVAALRLQEEVEGPPRLTRGEGVRVSDIDDFIEQPLPPQPSTGYRCVQCEWESCDRVEFVKHVRQHQVAGQHQCVECGQCYSTEASLRKHLLLVHKLRRLPAETVLPVGDKDNETARWNRLVADVADGDCRVCGLHLVDDYALQQHLRTHGMHHLRAHLTDQERSGRRQKRQSAAVSSSAVDSSESATGETLEQIAQFVAAADKPSSGMAVIDDVNDDDEEEEVIELEMKEGQITQKQLRKKGPVSRPEESSDEESTLTENNGDSAADVNVTNGDNVTTIVLQTSAN